MAPKGGNPPRPGSQNGHAQTYRSRAFSILRHGCPSAGGITVTEEMAKVLVRYYGLSEDGAREVAMALRDKTSLRSLAGYRVARAVQRLHTAQRS